jgi:Fur family peroxide stress response transcriptional regulator
MINDQQLIQAIQKSGLRVTPQRLAVYRALVNTDSHPTAQMLYETLRPEHPTLSLATVYNTLEALVAAGLVHSLGAAGDEAVHYDADTSPHVNLACVSCHRVIDLVSEHVDRLEHEVASTSGYRLLGSRVMYYGLCPECQAQQEG